VLLFSFDGVLLQLIDSKPLGLKLWASFAFTARTSSSNRTLVIALMRLHRVFPAYAVETCKHRTSQPKKRYIFLAWLGSMHMLNNGESFEKK